MRGTYWAIRQIAAVPLHTSWVFRGNILVSAVNLHYECEGAQPTRISL